MQRSFNTDVPRQSNSSADATAARLVAGPPQGQEQQLSESVHRRREQYRGYQRRRRARQQATLIRLEREVETLAHSIETLRHENSHLFSSRGTGEGAPASLVAAFYRIFEHGLVPSQSDSQEQFLRTMMASDVQGPDYSSVGALAEQWRLYARCSEWLSCRPQETTVVTIDESTVVTVDVRTAMRLNRGGVECLFPSVIGDEAMVQQLLANRLDVHGSVRFEFNAAGVVTWCGADMDFISSLHPVLGSLERVNACVQHSGISLVTGRISPDPQTVARAVQHDAIGRHDIEFLLT